MRACSLAAVWFRGFRVIGAVGVTICEGCPARLSTLPFAPADVIAVRLLPAQFARVVGVSKQSVSKWIHAGKVTIGPDGRLDPAKAIQEVLKNTAPPRLRARMFRQAMGGADAMRAENLALLRKVAALEQLLAEKDRQGGQSPAVDVLFAKPDSGGK